MRLTALAVSAIDAFEILCVGIDVERECVNLRVPMGVLGSPRSLLQPRSANEETLKHLAPAPCRLTQHAEGDHIVSTGNRRLTSRSGRVP